MAASGCAVAVTICPVATPILFVPKSKPNKVLGTLGSFAEVFFSCSESLTDVIMRGLRRYLIVMGRRLNVVRKYSNVVRPVC